MTTLQEIAARCDHAERMTRFAFGPITALRYGIGDGHFPAALYALIDLGVIDLASERMESAP